MLFMAVLCWRRVDNVVGGGLFLLLFVMIMLLLAVTRCFPFSLLLFVWLLMVERANGRTFQRALRQNLVLSQRY